MTKIEFFIQEYETIQSLRLTLGELYKHKSFGVVPREIRKADLLLHRRQIQIAHHLPTKGKETVTNG